MSWNDFVYGLGDLFEATFEILPLLENLPNVLFTLTIFGGLVYWMIQLKKYKAQSKIDGSIE